METQEDGQLGAGTDDGTVNISLYRTRGVVGFPEAARPAGEQSSIMRRLAEHLFCVLHSYRHQSEQLTVDECMPFSKARW